MINPVNIWAKSYQDKWDAVFKDASKEGFNAPTATREAWASWCDENGKPSCTAPLMPPLVLVATTNPQSFNPLDFSSSKSPAQAAKILADAWKAWAGGMVWTPTPPGPPFSAVTNVVTQPGSLSAAYATLLSGLIAEMAVVPKDASAVPAKYQALGTLFYTAVTSLQVSFIGMDLSAPPKPLVITVPVF